MILFFLAKHKGLGDGSRPLHNTVAWCPGLSKVTGKTDHLQKQKQQVSSIFPFGFTQSTNPVSWVKVLSFTHCHDYMNVADLYAITSTYKHCFYVFSPIHREAMTLPQHDWWVAMMVPEHFIWYCGKTHTQWYQIQLFGTGFQCPYWFFRHETLNYFTACNTALLIICIEQYEDRMILTSLRTTSGAWTDLKYFCYHYMGFFKLWPWEQIHQMFRDCWSKYIKHSCFVCCFLSNYWT